MNRHLWLDLEDTVIEPLNDGWNSVKIINVDKIKEFIRIFNPTSVNIFSFALLDDHDLEQFNELIRHDLETAIGMTISMVPTMNGQIITQCCKLISINPATVDSFELRSFWGKQIAFQLFIRSMATNNPKSIEVALLDDVVFNERFEWPDLQVKGQILNINTI